MGSSHSQNELLKENEIGTSNSRLTRRLSDNSLKGLEKINYQQGNLAKSTLFRINQGYQADIKTEDQQQHILFQSNQVRKQMGISLVGDNYHKRSKSFDLVQQQNNQQQLYQQPPCIQSLVSTQHTEQMGQSKSNNQANKLSDQVKQCENHHGINLAHLDSQTPHFIGNQTCLIPDNQGNTNNKYVPNTQRQTISNYYCIEDQGRSQTQRISHIIPNNNNATDCSYQDQNYYQNEYQELPIYQQYQQQIKQQTQQPQEQPQQLDQINTETSLVLTSKIRSQNLKNSKVAQFDSINTNKQVENSIVQFDVQDFYNNNNNNNNGNNNGRNTTNVITNINNTNSNNGGNSSSITNRQSFLTKKNESEQQQSHFQKSVNQQQTSLTQRLLPPISQEEMEKNAQSSRSKEITPNDCVSITRRFMKELEEIKIAKRDAKKDRTQNKSVIITPAHDSNNSDLLSQSQISQHYLEQPLEANTGRISQLSQKEKVQSSSHTIPQESKINKINLDQDQIYYTQLEGPNKIVKSHLKQKLTHKIKQIKQQTGIDIEKFVNQVYRSIREKNLTTDQQLQLFQSLIRSSAKSSSSDSELSHEGQSLEESKIKQPLTNSQEGSRMEFVDSQTNQHSVHQENQQQPFNYKSIIIHPTQYNTSEGNQSIPAQEFQTNCQDCYEQKQQCIQKRDGEEEVQNKTSRDKTSSIYHLEEERPRKSREQTISNLLSTTQNQKENIQNSPTFQFAVHENLNPNQIIQSVRQSNGNQSSQAGQSQQTKLCSTNKPLEIYSFDNNQQKNQQGAPLQSIQNLVRKSLTECQKLIDESNSMLQGVDKQIGQTQRNLTQQTELSSELRSEFQEKVEKLEDSYQKNSEGTDNINNFIENIQTKSSSNESNNINKEEKQCQKLDNTYANKQEINEFLREIKQAKKNIKDKIKYLLGQTKILGQSSQLSSSLQVNYNEVDIKLHYIELNRLEIEKYMKLLEQVENQAQLLEESQDSTSITKQCQKCSKDLQKLFAQNREKIEGFLNAIQEKIQCIINTLNAYATSQSQTQSIQQVKI